MCFEELKSKLEDFVGESSLRTTPCLDIVHIMPISALLMTIYEGIRCSQLSFDALDS